jgi:hypothetical protein
MRAGGVLYPSWLGSSMGPAPTGACAAGSGPSASQPSARNSRAMLEGILLRLRWPKGPAEKFAKRRLSHFLL